MKDFASCVIIILTTEVGVARVVLEEGWRLVEYQSAALHNFIEVDTCHCFACS